MREGLVLPSPVRCGRAECAGEQKGGMALLANREEVVLESSGAGRGGERNCNCHLLVFGEGSHILT